MFDRKKMLLSGVALSSVFFARFMPEEVAQLRRELGIADNEHLEFRFVTDEVFDDKVLRVVVRNDSGEITESYTIVFSHRRKLVRIETQSDERNCVIVDMKTNSDDRDHLMGYWLFAQSYSNEYWVTSGNFAYQLSYDSFKRYLSEVNRYLNRYDNTRGLI